VKKPFQQIGTKVRNVGLGENKGDGGKKGENDLNQLSLECRVWQRKHEVEPEGVLKQENKRDLGGKRAWTESETGTGLGATSGKPIRWQSISGPVTGKKSDKESNKLTRTEHCTRRSGDVLATNGKKTPD